MSAVPAIPQRAVTEIEALVDLARALTVSAGDVHKIGSLATDRIAELMCDQAALELVPPGGGEPTCVGSPCPPACDVLLGRSDRTAPPCGSRLLGHRARWTAITRVLATGKPIVLGAAESGRYGAGAIALIAVQVDGRNTGVLILTRRPDRPPYTGTEIVFAQGLAGVIGIALDVGRMLENSTLAMEELRQQYELIDHVSDAIIACDATCAVVNWSRAAERLYWYEEGEALDCDLFTLLCTEFFTLDGWAVSREEVLESVRLTGGWHGALRERRADGARIDTIASVTTLPGANGALPGLMCVNRDVTEQRQKEHLAAHDPLTGLPNRRVLFDRLDRAITRCRNRGTALAVLFFDLDRFKPINDTLGHKAGDEVLCVTANRLTSALRHDDLVTRLGGDEFVAVTEDLSRADSAEQLAHRLLALLAEPIVLGGQTVTVTSSVGVAVTSAPPSDSDTPEKLLRAADGAMYAAKQSRRGVVCAA